jgi:Ca-activated chloride channel family protein
MAVVMGSFAMPAVAQEDAIIVLDGSGSMWGQIDGTPKIAIARDVLGSVLGSVPSSTSLGFMAYGHREKGNCADIELLMAPAPGAAAEIVGMAKEINPRGKTPLSDAVRRAAEALRFKESKATVILITDGLETCNADPCAVAQELEATGVDFTAHVVGFGLSAEEGRQVGCLAEETGGKYIPAANAGALVEALSETVADVAEPPPPPEAAPGPATLPEASLAAPETVEIGRSFVVAWEGPGERYDYVALVDPAGNNGEGRDLRSRRIVNADFDNLQVGLTAPVTPGTYELQYRYGNQRTVIATRPIEIVESEVSLSAPANADIGSTIVIDWIGPGAQRDSIELYNPTALQGEGKVLFAKRIRNGDFDGRQVSLVVPTEPGFYQLRYFSGDDRKVLATREIEVLEAEVSLSAPDSVDIGRAFTVSWVGPGANRDSVELFDPAGNNGNGRVVTYRRIVNGDRDNRTVDLVAPTDTGAYQLRYFNGDSRAVLATRPIDVAAAEVSVSGPESVDIGRTFTVSWVGPGANRDSVELFDPAGNNGNGRVVTYRRIVNGDRDNQTVDLVAPTEAGAYQLRYFNGDSRAVLATSPIEVIETEVTVSAPESVDFGRSFEVSWVGPGGKRDAIEVFDPDGNNGKGRVVYSKRLINDDYDGQTVELLAPAIAGDYQIRYWNGDSRAVLANAPVSVVATEVTLSAPDEVAAGEAFTAAWVGPGATRDSIDVVSGEAASGKVVASTRVINGDYDAQTVKVKAPKEPGSYLLRYWSGESKVVLASRPIAVK